MKVLFCCDDTRPEPWLKGLHDALPGAEIAIWEPGAPQADYALVWAPPQQFLDEQAAGLKAMFNSGAGVDALLPLRIPAALPVYRLEDAGMAVQMAEYVAQAVIRFFRGLDQYEADMAQGLWQHQRNPRRADYPVGVMGLGKMGERVAKALTVFDFKLNGWSRSLRDMDGVQCFGGMAQLDDFLRQSRILVNLLPLHAETENIINARTLALLQPAAAAAAADSLHNAASPLPRLPSVYPQILAVLQRSAHSDWPPALQAELAAAEATSRRTGHAAMAGLNLPAGRYYLVLAGTPASYALHIDLRTTIPTDEWPMDMATSPVRVTLEHGGTAFVVQPGQADRGSGIRTYDFHKLLAAPSQPLDVVARRSVGLHELPWWRMLGWCLLTAALWAAGRAL